MNKTILLGGPDSYFSSKTLKLFFYSIGLIQLILAGLELYSKSDSFLGLSWLALGVFYFFYGYVIYSETPISPKITITDSEVKFKNTVLKNFTKLDWADIALIDFGSFEIEFQLKNGNKKFKYDSNADVSLEIKKSIRQVADEKGIEISGG